MSVQMDERVRNVLSSLEQWGRANDATESEHSRKMLNLDSEAAALVSVLARTARAENVLEVGTSNGYSTIWLAWSILLNTKSLGHSRADAAVTTIDRAPEKQAMARKNLSDAGLRDLVTFHLGDATEIIKRLTTTTERPFDLVFFDADRVSAAEQLRMLLPRLSRRAVLVADNALSHPTEIEGYIRSVERLPKTSHVIVPVGKGLSVAYRDLDLE